MRECVGRVGEELLGVLGAFDQSTLGSKARFLVFVSDGCLGRDDEASEASRTVSIVDFSIVRGAFAQSILGSNALFRTCDWGDAASGLFSVSMAGLIA